MHFSDNSFAYFLRKPEYFHHLLFKKENTLAFALSNQDFLYSNNYLFEMIFSSLITSKQCQTEKNRYFAVNLQNTDNCCFLINFPEDAAHLIP